MNKRYAQLPVYTIFQMPLNLTQRLTLRPVKFKLAGVQMS